ncbi:MAG TPA: hypothetical protein HPP83_10540 [Candidatus Hydrogenedentes bacterium]|nr:hypothetical protein [Candidatus Hydrogenedentota bacterium]
MVNQIQLRPLAAPVAPPTRRPTASTASTPFSHILESEVRKAGQVKFSAHAQLRLRTRGISLTADDLARIGRGLDLAAAKGARESLLLMDRLALVVSVPNRTVITVVEQNEIEDTVFTNIDSAVVVAEQPEAATETVESNGLDPIRGSLGVVER